jgi:hypothetical protein
MVMHAATVKLTVKVPRVGQALDELQFKHKAIHVVAAYLLFRKVPMVLQLSVVLPAYGRDAGLN